MMLTICNKKKIKTSFAVASFQNNRSPMLCRNNCKIKPLKTWFSHGSASVLWGSIEVVSEGQLNSNSVFLTCLPLTCGYWRASTLSGNMSRLYCSKNVETHTVVQETSSRDDQNGRRSEFRMQNWMMGSVLFICSYQTATYPLKDSGFCWNTGLFFVVLGFFCLGYFCFVFVFLERGNSKLSCKPLILRIHQESTLNSYRTVYESCNLFSFKCM